jgi:hypothetical protein
VQATATDAAIHPARDAQAPPAAFMVLRFMTRSSSRPLAWLEMYFLDDADATNILSVTNIT